MTHYPLSYMKYKIDEALTAANDGCFRDAYDALDTLMLESPVHDDVLFLKARVAMDARLWREALDILEKLSQPPCCNCMMSLFRATCLVHLNRLGKAEDVLDAMNEKAQNGYVALILRGEAAYRRENYPLAKEYAKLAINANPNRCATMLQGYQGLSYLLSVPIEYLN